MVATLDANRGDQGGQGEATHQPEGPAHTRPVVSKTLRGDVGKMELRRPLGGANRQALRPFPGSGAELQREISIAEHKVGQGADLEKWSFAGSFCGFRDPGLEQGDDPCPGKVAI